MSSVVFYVRSLSKETPFFEFISPDLKDKAIAVVEIFNSISKISFQDYRNALHSIQLENLKDIGLPVIINTRENSNAEEIPFKRIQPTALKTILSLPKDTILIPTDEDDWISPTIKEIDFVNGITGWNVSSLSFTNISYRNKKQFPLDLKSISNKEISELEAGFDSNCQSMSLDFILHNKHQLHKLVQRHSCSRFIIREEHNRSNELYTEKFIDNNSLSVSLRHLANLSKYLTRIKLVNDTALLKNFIKELFDKTKQQLRHPLILNAELSWAKRYQKQFLDITAAAVC